MHTFLVASLAQSVFIVNPMSHSLTPADVVERLIGHPTLVGAIVGRDRTSVIKWRTGGRRRSPGSIPGDEEKRALLAHARKHGIPLTAEHLIHGADPAEIEALLAPEQVAAE